ncbi:MAG: DNA-3-methyladenine glycosylase [Flavobacteriales bacterium]|nr:putative 3-methyladenine DNA glycosylase [Flavobacteriales bacterium]MCC6578774.1 DNA-3-methyladenine glycosylase [Flavobacteriales bacterium]NUQ13761.1 DNA-3-methyladenine glycosylase [Flavobacteriales bacterium]
MRLDRDFYERTDVVAIARELLGMVVHTRIGGSHVAAAITETEAYAGVNDRASHAFNGRRTARNECLYARGGTAYVYICYGIHHLFNIVTHAEGVPHAVLVRGVQVLEGRSAADRRRGRPGAATDGPGTAAQALGIRRTHDGTDLLGDRIWIADEGRIIDPATVRTGPRIGVDYAGPDALLPYRFRIHLP